MTFLLTDISDKIIIKFSIFIYMPTKVSVLEISEKWVQRIEKLFC